MGDWKLGVAPKRRMNPAPQPPPRLRGGGVRGGFPEVEKVSIILLLCDAGNWGWGVGHWETMILFPLRTAHAPRTYFCSPGTIFVSM